MKKHIIILPMIGVTLILIISGCSKNTKTGNEYKYRDVIDGIPVYFKRNEWYHAKDKKLKDPAKYPQRQKIVSYAKKFIGVSYKYGGNSPQQGFDCSGLVHYVFKKNGISLPRTSKAQYKATNAVHQYNAKPGDLLFFDINGKGVSHVGIYIGKMKFIHAPHTGKKVSIVSLDNKYWQKRFLGVHKANK